MVFKCGDVVQSEAKIPDLVVCERTIEKWKHPSIVTHRCPKHQYSFDRDVFDMGLIRLSLVNNPSNKSKFRLVKSVD